MSKVTIQGNASGTGTFTIAAPNSNTDRTFNLPDHTGTVLASDSITVDETNGRLGIGTTSIEGLLHVREDQDGTTNSIIHNRSTTGTPVTELNFITGGYNLSDGRYSYIQSAGGGSNYLAFGTSAGAAATEKMRIDSAGRVTTPNQPSFWAYCSADTNINVSAGTQVEFDSERFDVGSNFDTTAYRFTAPVTGKYFFSAGCRVDDVDTAANYYRFRIVVSNKEISSIIRPRFSADVTYYTRHLSSVFDMDANDTAQVNFVQSAGHSTSHVDSSDVYTWFAGYLLG